MRVLYMVTEAYSNFRLELAKKTMLSIIYLYIFKKGDYPLICKVGFGSYRYTQSRWNCPNDPFIVTLFAV